MFTYFGALFTFSLLPILALICLIWIIVSGYVKAPPDEAKIISGMGKDPKVIIGRASVRIPFLTKVDSLDLAMLSIDVKTSKTIPTLDYINIMVDAVAVVKISSEAELIKLAAQNFLNRDSEYISAMVVNVLEGNLREIIGQMKLTEIMNDRKSFAEKVIDNAGSDMKKMGLEIISFNIQNIDDNNLGVIENLGIANTVEIQRSAEISKANAQKEIAVAQAKAEQAANEERVLADKDIAEKQNELAIKKAQLEQEKAAEQAKAAAAPLIAAQIQQKDLNAREVEAEIEKAQRERELKEAEVLVKQQELAATIEKQADAEKYKKEKEAEAELIQRTKAAEAALVEKKKEAEGIAAVGQAEAEAIRAKGIAEAEAMEKKADAYERYGKAAMLDMMTKILPDMADAIAKPLSSIDSVKIYGTDGSQASGMSGNMPVVMRQVFDTMTNATGVDFTDILKAETYDAKVEKNIHLDAGIEKAAETIAKEITKKDISKAVKGDIDNEKD